MEARRALIVHPPLSAARDFIDYPYFSDLGAVQLAAVLRARGCEVGLVDSFALPASSLTWRADGRCLLGAPVGDVLAAVREDLARRGAFDIAVVAYTPFHRPPERDDVLGALLEGLRALLPSTPLVLADAYQSGQHYVDAPGTRVLAAYPECDAYVQYEAEETLPALVDALPARPSGAYHGAEPPSLDALPAPAWDLVDLGAHDRFLARVVKHLGRGAWAFPIDGRTLPMVTSRGCPFTCAHCSSNPGRAEGTPKTQRRHSAAVLRARLDDMVRVHGATRVEVLDELVNVNERHWEAFLDAVDALNVRFDVPNGMRADYLSADHLRRMRPRVSTVSVSAESGVQRVVTEVVGKRLDLGEIVRVARDAHEARVPLMVHYIIGMPGESAAEINATLAFALDLYTRFGAVPAVQYATPLPGTALAKGRVLPVVDDWGPRFQTEPSQPGMSVTPDALRTFRRSFEARMEASRAPASAVLYATHLCNNHCSFCATGPRTGLREHPPDLRAALDRLRREGVESLEIDGGEPTLRPDLMGLIRHARALGFSRVGLHTNGRMCAYERYARSLVGAGLTSIRVGLHGATAATHDRVVGVVGAFEQTVTGLRHLLRHAPDGLALSASFTPVRDNLAELDDTLALAHSLGLRRVDLRALTPMGPDTREIAPDPEALTEALQRALTRWSGRLTVRVHDLPFCLLPGHEGSVERDVSRAVHVTQQGVDLPGYLASQRVRKPVCEGCAYRMACDGFHELDAPSTPPWMVRPESLSRREATSPSPVHGESPAIRHVGILGGGTAGYLTALALRKRRPDLRVSLVESSTIPIIGVGEATTPDLVDFLLNTLGVDELELYREVLPTWKLGIRFFWGPPGPSHFHHPFQGEHLHDAYARRGDHELQSLSNQLMERDLTPVLRDDGGRIVSLLATTPYAFNLDNVRFVRYLHKLAERAGVERVDCVVDDVSLAPDGSVDHLRTSDGRALRFDLYVDASGFRSVLLERALGVPFESYASTLFCDAAVTFDVPHHGPIAPYTLAETMDAGWAWGIPQFELNHRGYVFSSRFISADEALAEARRKNPTTPTTEPRLVRFRSGRMRACWEKNVFGVGNSYAFVEPLESTAIHMVLYEVGELIDALPHAGSGGAVRERVNERIAGHWDKLRDFLALHYRFNRKLDTPFWRACRAEVALHGAEALLAAWRDGAPLTARPDRARLEDTLHMSGFFGLLGVDNLLLGQRVPTRILAPRGDGAAFEHWVTHVLPSLLSRALPHREALDAYVAWLSQR